MIELRGVTVTRGSQRIVRDLDLRLEPGRVFWIIGPNGAGKSSLLRVLAGLEPPSSGRVESRPCPGRPPLYFHSEMRIPGSATVGDWERLARRLRAGEGGEDRVGLWPGVAPERPVGRLSTGERKRLLLDVLLRQPGPLLLDEPFEHLSPDAKAVLGERLQARARRGLVVVATNQATQRARCDGGLRLEAGRAVALEPAAAPPAAGRGVRT